jgi:hypothetical protein
MNTDTDTDTDTAPPPPDEDAAEAARAAAAADPREEPGTAPEGRHEGADALPQGEPDEEP